MTPDEASECTRCGTPDDREPVIPAFYDGRLWWVCRDCLSRLGNK